MSNVRSVLVTGAGGFIGRRVVAVAESAGLEVLPVARRRIGDGSLTLDLTRPLVELPPVDAVFHLAGAYAGGGRGVFEPCDLEIARRLLTWGERAGVRHWVFASAAEVYGRCSEPATESTPPAPRIPYGRAKLTVEGWLESLSQRHPHHRVVALRIGEVYGRGGTLVEELSRRLRRGFCPWFGSGRVPVSFAHVDDVARSFVAASRWSEPGFSVFNVADDRPTQWREFLVDFARLLGTRPPVPLPLAAAYAYAALCTLADRLRQRRPTITRFMVRLLTTPKPMSNTRLRESLALELLYPDHRRGLEQILSVAPSKTGS